LALGGSIQVPTLDGFAKLKISSGTENGKVFRLRSKGMPRVDGYGRGDMQVQIIAEIPAKLNGSQKKLLQEYQANLVDKNYPDSKKFREKAEKFLERKKAMKR
jgi:molecular chaperone DnaJ